MEECDILVDWLAKTLGMRQGVITGHEVPNRFCSQIPVLNVNLAMGRWGAELLNPRIHKLDHKRVKENIIVKILRFFQRRALEYVC